MGVRAFAFKLFNPTKEQLDSGLYDEDNRHWLTQEELSKWLAYWKDRDESGDLTKYQDKDGNLPKTHHELLLMAHRLIAEEAEVQIVHCP